jgi:hypothetical protein
VATLDEESRVALEARIVREARAFELKPLMELLIRKGYPREEIVLEGTRDGTSANLVEAVQFKTEPERLVVVKLNLGLLGDNTLLPSYFFAMADKTAEPERFEDFIRFFDHRLIQNLLRALYPDEDGALYRDWSEVLRSFFRMLGPSSVATLHWVAQRYFPDLGVDVGRCAFLDTTEAHAAVTGESLLDGSAILGRAYQSDTAGFGLDLFADEETNDRGIGWPNIVKLRLNERVLPLLAPFRVPLRVRLTVRRHASWARVDIPFAANRGYLGYERIEGDPDAGHTTVIYRGTTGVRLRV